METVYNVEKVPVTVHLTPEAAKTLLQYAGPRNRGRFLSDLIMAQRRRDELEGEMVTNQPLQASAEPPQPLIEAPKRVQAANHTGARNKRRKRR